MTKKPTVTTIAGGYYSRQALNDNFEALRDAFDNTLSRDGSTPNAMGADLDMNSNDILNANEVNTSSLRLNGVLVSPADLSSAGSVMYSNKFTGDGSTAAYTLSYDPYIKDNTLVYIDGVYQNKDGYAVSGTTLTFSEAPPLNSLVEVVVARTLEAVGTADASAVTFLQSGTGAQTRTVESKLQEFVSVKDFGDIDGIGTITLNVPSEFSTIQDALDYLAPRTIASGSKVRIKVADGTYTLSSGLLFNHPQGSQIELVGNQSTPTNCVITVSGTPTFDALAVTNGNTLGFLDGFYFTLAAKAEMPNNFTAILANNGANIICGPNVRVNNWYYGIAARNGSFISCDYAEVNNAGDVGIWAFVGSTVYCRNAVADNTSDAVSALGFGIQAEYGSAIDCSNASASGNKIGGIASLSNSNVRALSCTASTNIGSGFFARDDGSIECHNSTANNNTRYGIEQIGTSRVVGNSLTLTGNTLADVKPIVALDNGSLGPRIDTPNGGDLRLDATDAHYFNSENGLQFAINKGPASTVNQVSVTGSATGDPVQISASGSDAVVDLYLVPKGAGSYVRLAAGYTATPLTIAGYIEVKDNTGTVRKLAVVS